MRSRAAGQGFTRRAYLPIVLVALAGSALSGWFSWVAQERERAVYQAKFEEAAASHAAALQRRVERSLEVVDSVGGLFTAAPQVSRGAFHAFVAGPLASHRGIQALEWVPRVAARERPQYEKSAHAAGLHNFHFTERKPPDRLVAAQARETYFPVWLLEPLKGNEAALGFDLGSEPTRLAAMEQARDSGSMIATARVNLVQEKGRLFGVIVFRPVYEGGGVPRDVNERRSRLKGFALGVFRIGEIVEQALDDIPAAGLDISLQDETAPTDERLLYFHASRTRAPGAGLSPAPPMQLRIPLELPGRQWQMLFSPAPGFEAEYAPRQGWIVLGVGLLFTAFLAAYMVANARHNGRIAALAADLSTINTGLLSEMNERKRIEEALRLNNGALAEAQRMAHLGNWQWDPVSDRVSGSEEARRILGLAPLAEAALDELLQRIHPGDREGLKRGLVRAAQEQRPLRIDFRVLSADGEARTIHAKAEFCRGEHEEELLVGTVQDITERKRIEEELKQTAEKLERSNRNLQEFAYVVSHDLQEPLRMVSSYLQLIARRYKGKLDQDADEFIAFAVDGANRMSEMINGLLQYSRVESKGEPFQPTEMEAVLERALENLQLSLEESQAEVTHDPLPTLVTDESQMVRLMQNLIGNAIKYRGEEPPKIHISATQEENGDHFTVRDNGIGITEKDAERIFTIFQRLHTQSEIAGTGIGLAVCKRIVERHGGRIWVESVPGEGSTFHFTIPTRESALQ